MVEKGAKKWLGDNKNIYFYGGDFMNCKCHTHSFIYQTSPNQKKPTTHKNKLYFLCDIKSAIPSVNLGPNSFPYNTRKLFAVHSIHIDRNSDDMTNTTIPPKNKNRTTSNNNKNTKKFIWKSWKTNPFFPTFGLIVKYSIKCISAVKHEIEFQIHTYFVIVIRCMFDYSWRAAFNIHLLWH